ncbi:hypothetical protein BELINDA_9 [Bacillus phage Belinda]|uniref:hypothetical protein n=1 Tax=Bacillus phage Belinda TaxID=1852564 RepID=UPI0007F06588|nr:hypothetical protein BI039_gp009 [Bacillus phage Belinda]ANM45938.1 hypothetical protein BELINDA_9 [Bacillus phage Belinda]
MTRHTRNKQLRDLNKEMYENYEINMTMPTSIMFEKGAGTLDKDFKWNRYSMRTLSAAYWKGKRFNKKTGKDNWKVRVTKVTNYVSYRANDNNLFGFTHVV